METVKQIKQLCLETGNEWFLTHPFPQMALYDLQLKEELEKENVGFHFDDRECVCSQDQYCIWCDVELERKYYFDNDLGFANTAVNGVFDFDKCIIHKSLWIFPEKIDGEIPGFILIKCSGDGLCGEGFTHELVFACVRYKYRKRGILKTMVNRIPKEWKVWLEAKSKDPDIEQVEDIWEKCGFSYYTHLYNHVIMVLAQHGQFPETSIYDEHY